MSSERVRLVERSYMSFVLKQNPDYYAEARNTSRTEYEFSNGRRFTGHNIYSNYFPRYFHITDEGLPVYDEGIPVMVELTEAEYLEEFAV
jgi:hypothetical protein